MRLLRDSSIPTLLCLPLGLLAAAGAHCAILLPAWYEAFAVHRRQIDARAVGELPMAGVLLAGPGAIQALIVALYLCAALWLVASAAGLLVRRGWALALVRAGYVAIFVAGLVFAQAVFAGIGALADVLSRAGSVVGAVDKLVLRWDYLRWVLLAGLPAAGMLVVSWRRKAIALYLPAADGPAAGDRIIEDIRTSGRDPTYRKSWLASAMLHWFLIFALPFLWALRGCVTPYLVPLGSGKPAVTRVMRVVKRQKKPRKKYIVRTNAAIYWDIPDLDESKIAEEVERDTRLTHVADRNAVHGQMGAGGGNKGGWPEGVPGGRIRFIRLEYRGSDWDDGMDARSRADINFLAFLKREVPFPVARAGESHLIRLLRRYPKGFAPPFVYMTGSESIYASRDDVKCLREYLLDGGMLFADCGSSRWHTSFLSFIRGVFPDKRLIDIADDDEIFQMPYTFPNGAPPLWHHGGMRALGIKHKGRWVVFYHPGDLNDAWKTGHSGMDPELADKAFQMGINVLYYAITQYLELTKRHRKP